MTIRNLLLWSTNELRAVAPDDAARDAEHLLAHVIQKPREYVLAHDDATIAPIEIGEYKQLIDRRRNREPLAHCLGYAYFFGLPFEVNENVLIPRPETELLVDTVHNYLDVYNQSGPAHIVDVGTGSGAIIVSLAVACASPHRSFHAIDISPLALETAQKNAHTYGVKRTIQFHEGSLLDPILETLQRPTHRKFIVANLPYLPEYIVNAAPDLAHEPRLALASGKDGLDAYRGLFATMESVTPPWTLFMEIDPIILDSFSKLLTYHFPDTEPTILNDLHDDERVCIVEKQKTL